MNNKEFTSELSRRLGYTLKDTSELVASLLSDMTRQLEEGNIISIQGFGTFEVKKEGRAYICESDYKATYAGASQIGIDL